MDLTVGPVSLPGELRPYDRSQPAIFLHMPRTGGTSLSGVLESWFGPRLHRHYRDGDVAPRRGELRAGDLVLGHFNGLRGLGVADYYPDVRQFATVLRDPFDRCVSQWLYLSRRGSPLLGPDGIERGFGAWLERRAVLFAQGRDDFAMNAQMPDLRPVNVIAVGLTEHMDETLQILAAAFGQPYRAAPHVNSAEGDSTSFECWRAQHRRTFQEEYRLYESGRALFEASQRLYLQKV